jgi:hypothetical protein
MLRERKQLEGIQNKDNDSEPSLVLPQLSKTETKAYAPGEFNAPIYSVIVKRFGLGCPRLDYWP